MSKWNTLAGLMICTFLQTPSGMAAETAPGVIVGDAAFEQRETIVPISFSDLPSVTFSETYWVLVVRDHGLTYQLDQHFAPGEHKAPEMVELKLIPDSETSPAILIRPGSHLRIAGQITPLTETFAMFSEIERI